MERLISLERILTDAAECRNFAPNDLKEFLGAHVADFDISRLSAQLVLLPTLLRDEGPAASKRILQILQGKSADMRKMIDQVVRYLQLVFSVPASAASGVRSFSALRRVKTLLRNRMTQRRLTHLRLHVHKKRAAELHLDAVMKEFVSRTAERPPLTTSPTQRPLVMPAMKLLSANVSACSTSVIVADTSHLPPAPALNHGRGQPPQQHVLMDTSENGPVTSQSSEEPKNDDPWITVKSRKSKWTPSKAPENTSMSTTTQETQHAQTTVAPVHRRLPPLPKDDYKVIFRPRETFTLARWQTDQIANSIKRASNQPIGTCTQTMIVRIEPQQNIAIASVPDRDYAIKLIGIKSLQLGEKEYAVTAYAATPDNSGKGVIHGITPGTSGEHLTAARDCPERYRNQSKKTADQRESRPTIRQPQNSSRAGTRSKSRSRSRQRSTSRARHIAAPGQQKSTNSQEQLLAFREQLADNVPVKGKKRKKPKANSSVEDLDRSMENAPLPHDGEQPG
ncbi:hypothetical protein HPB49_007431 [Dermacentor silvarum]|uniref:Uncharacterized protein n=1 Tax=Dermacentor silvarum TaxID=543639 RepID=A0ACB8DX55_DERSI|nr:hypothetical protein HPB49_007431 [Dermacentor silvarum]